MVFGESLFYAIQINFVVLTGVIFLLSFNKVNNEWKITPYKSVADRKPYVNRKRIDKCRQVRLYPVPVVSHTMVVAVELFHSVQFSFRDAKQTYVKFSKVGQFPLPGLSYSTTCRSPANQ